METKIITVTRSPSPVVTLARVAVGGGGGGAAYDDAWIRAEVSALEAADAEMLDSLNELAVAVGNLPRVVVQTLADGPAVAWDAGLGSVAMLPLAAAGRTMVSPLGLVAGRQYVLAVTNVTGAGSITAWGTAYKFPGGVKPPLSTTAGAVDVFCFVATGSAALHLVTAAFDSK